jgi:hypothetical protein
MEHPKSTDWKEASRAPQPSHVGLRPLANAAFPSSSDAAPPADALIRAHVREALDACADLDASRLEVVVHDGEVLLIGYVRDLFEKEFAHDVATTCRGPRRVVSAIKVFPRARPRMMVRASPIRAVHWDRDVSDAVDDRAGGPSRNSDQDAP